MQTNKPGKYTQYYEKDYDATIQWKTEHFRCKICNKILAGQGNVVQHIKKIHFPPAVISKQTEGDYFSIFEYNGKPITQDMVDLLSWKSRYGIPFSSLDSPLFKRLIRFEIPSDKTMALILNSISEQILKINMKRFSNQFLSIVADGGTIIHHKWLALGTLFQIGGHLEYNILDVYVVDQSMTSIYLKGVIESLQKQLNSINSIIVGICTDNASNFTSAFGDEIDSARDLDIIRIPCACHTVQLGIKDFISQNSILKNFKTVIKKLSEKLSHFSMEKLKKLNLNRPFPTYQSQRWNSFYYGMVYLRDEYFGTHALLREMNIPYEPIEIDPIIEAFELPYLFTKKIEGDRINLSQAYLEYTTMMKIIKNLAEAGNLYAKGLGEAIHNRMAVWVQYGKCANYFSNNGINEFQKNYKSIQMTNRSNDQNMLFDEKLRLEIYIKNLVNQIVGIWPKFIDRRPTIGDLVIEILNKAEIQNYDSDKYLNYNELCEIIGVSNALDVLEVSKRLVALPPTEAACERIFAQMRELTTSNMSRLETKNLRSQLIMCYYARQTLAKDIPNIPNCK